MQLFQYGRTNGVPTIYNTNQTPVTVDVIQTIILSTFFIIAIAFIVIAPGYGRKKSVHMILKAVISVLIGTSLMMANYGQEWEVGDVNSTIPYRVGDKRQFTAHICVKIGLRSINITLREHLPEKIASAQNNKLIKYNEEFLWIWDQGRFGFGPNAGNLQKSKRQAQKKGLPIPIIWILDYFCIDGEGLRYGRFYRTAGWYCHVLLWSALPVWLLVNIFSQSVGRYVAYFIGVIGVLEITSCAVWICVRNRNPLVIRFPDGEISMSFGSTFWFTCIGGILCLLLASALIIMDLRYPNTLSAFLGIDLLDQYDECVVRTIELDHMMEHNNQVESIELGKITRQFSTKNSGLILLKRRSTIKRAQKNLVHISSVPMNIYHYKDDTVLYVNEAIQPGPSDGDIINMKFKPPIPRRNMI